MERLETLRLLLLGDKTDTTSDDLFNTLETMAKNRMLFLVNRFESLSGKEKSTTIPKDLDWILDEVLIKRFNRLGSEGYLSQSVEGHSITFSTSEFAEFEDIIREFVEKQQKVRPGKLVIY